MTVGMIGKSKLKITLDPEESAELFCDAEKLSCTDPETRYALRMILGRAMTKTEFRLDCERLFVEIYPSAAGGFVIYFTKTPYRKRYKRNPDAKFLYLLEFSDSEQAISASKAFLSRSSEIAKSSLHKYNKRYYLVVSCSSKTRFSSALITEFADRCICSDTACAIVSEYGKPIINENAIEVLAKI